MKVVVVTNRLTDNQKLELGVKPDHNFKWQITPNKEYVVISLRNILNSDFYGNSILFEIEDDYGRLLAVPSCLFAISDPTPSKYWHASIENTVFSLEPKEFIGDPSLSEKILDREPDAMLIFDEIKRRLENESC
ncbi:hypothetical protein V4V48_004196 [Vibrio mimicus]